MSVKTDNVIQDAETEAALATQYWWAPFLTGAGMTGWACNTVTLGNVGTTAGDAMACFDYPLLLAARRGYVTQAQLLKLYQDLLGTTATQRAGLFSYWGYKLSVWRDWKAIPGSYWRPRRGDLVFFTAAGADGDINHVVLARGSTDVMGRAQVVSFGQSLSTPQSTAVNFSTVEQIKQAGHIAVKFTQPLWA
ncbi:MAG TPA: hypothetical protein VGF69_08350 [Thermoanaerobaculia bacterium]|jgi:hypothetical protein